MNGKTEWTGTVLSVQPRIRLLRSFDERSHTYLGYVLHIQGSIANAEGAFLIALGQAAQAKHQFRKGDEVAGASIPVNDQRLETAAYYKTTSLKMLKRALPTDQAEPPFVGVAPPLEMYRERGHRRLHALTYSRTCGPCIWACRMPVEIIVDHWKPGNVKHRFETFCYGPRSCPFYKAGATRKVPGRQGMTYEEEDWVDEQDTAHRD